LNEKQCAFIFQYPEIKDQFNYYKFHTIDRNLFLIIIEEYSITWF